VNCRLYGTAPYAAAVIHGDCDPHPAEGVRLPLVGRLADFRFHLLPRCGHSPWEERYAMDAFYGIVADALR
jgi:pimeloyl-ACP methyl ester carboxylesterase